jgi:YVTN family beta-propeller protein
MARRALGALLVALLAIVAILAVHCGRPFDAASQDAPPKPRRLLYVASPGLVGDLSHGGHGVLVFDIDDRHRFVKRIPSRGLASDGAPLPTRGICANASAQRFYVTTLEGMIAFDLRTDAILWEKRYDGGCDRMSITPDGAKVFTPSFEKDFWHVIDGRTGDAVARIPTERAAHNTIVSQDGAEAYLADRHSRLVQVVDTKTNQVLRKVGPFSAVVRPFTVNGRSTRLFANVDALLGFEIADLKSGAVLDRIEVPGFPVAPGRHSVPSHGVALAPDEREVWVTDGANHRLHVFDNTATRPRWVHSVALSDEPGWVTFSRDGRFVYPSTGDVIDAASRAIVARLVDENGTFVISEKMVEIDFDAAGIVSATGDQFGVGRVP